jgi:CubicO group peptidase (beta-lactamase class C family)
VAPQLPDYADLRSPEKDRITLRHLLTMSQGLAWDKDLPYSDPANSETQMDKAPDPVRYALSRLKSAKGSPPERLDASITLPVSLTS